MNPLTVFRFALLCEAKYHDYIVTNEEIRSVVDSDDVIRAQHGTVVIKLDDDDNIHLCGWNGGDLSAPWIKTGDGQYRLADNTIDTMAAGAQKVLDAIFFTRG